MCTDTIFSRSVDNVDENNSNSNKNVPYTISGVFPHPKEYWVDSEISAPQNWRSMMWKPQIVCPRLLNHSICWLNFSEICVYKILLKWSGILSSNTFKLLYKKVPGWWPTENHHWLQSSVIKMNKNQNVLVAWIDYKKPCESILQCCVKDENKRFLQYI